MTSPPTIGCVDPSARTVTPYLRLIIGTSSPSLRCKLPWGAQPWGAPEGKNGRPTGGSFSSPACTNAESLELARASSLGFFARVVPQSLSVLARDF
jgi:hypothetical protein